MTTHEDDARTTGTDRAGATLVDVEDLAFAYGDVSVFEDVSIEIRANAVTALIGPNGTGKTTLLRTLAGLAEPTAGAVRYHGPDVPREIGYLPQQPAFRPGFSAAETLAFYGSLVGESRAEVSARLERVGLADAADRNVEALSGGMTRLLGIAQAAIGDPPVVVLDEPASGLDPGMSAHIYEIARELADADTAVVVTSHDMGLVERTADVIALLDAGGVAVTGSPNALLDRFDVDSLHAVYEAAVSGDLTRVSVRGESA
ncbi:ABC transporter ATP-binding protein [Halovivax cerinus]|uniref:ABC transporter ATP-binding protein n=1 Tax=Halovivax cerinus TaxID=1487865 RepID=A0ABD5NQG6_9EURY|nr:ABC transporter ATP-binding protein [Halovivax cerinus]